MLKIDNSILSNWKNFILSKDQSENTANSYITDTKLFFQWLIKTKNYNIQLNEFDIDYIKKIEIIDINSYLLSLDKQANSTKNRKRISILMLFEYIETLYGYKLDNLEDKVIKIKKKKTMPTYLTIDESLKVLNSINNRNTIRNKTIVSMFLNTGLRVSELVSINVNDIYDINNKVIYSYFNVVGKGDKTRQIPINDNLKRQLETYLEYRLTLNTNEKSLFLSERMNRISNDAVRSMTKLVTNQTGIDKNITPHKLRHTAATLMYRGSHDILGLQQMLGHESISTTKIYTHIDSQNVMDMANKNPLNTLI